MKQAVRRMATDTIVKALAVGVVSLRGVGTLLIFSSSLSAADYGIFVQALLFAGLIQPLLTCRLELALVRFITGEEDLDAVRGRFYLALAYVLCAVTLAGGVFVLFAPAASELLFGTSDHAQIATLCGLLLPVTVLGVFLRQSYRAFDRIKQVSVIESVEAVLEVTLVAIAVFNGRGVIGAMLAVAGVRAIFAAGMASQLIALVGFGRPSWQLSMLWPMLVFGASLVPNGLMDWVMSFGDRLVIVHFLGLQSVGAYSASYALGDVLKLLWGPLQFAFYPFVLRLWRQGRHEFVSLAFALLTRYYLSAAIPAATGVAIISQPVLQRLAGPGFQTDTGLVLCVSLGIACQGLFQLNAIPYHLIHQTLVRTVFFLIGGALNLVLNLLTVPLIGLHGAALATLVTYVVLCVAAVHYAQGIIAYSIGLRDLLRSSLATSIMVAAVAWIPQDSWLGIAGVILGGITAYAISLYFVGGISGEDWRRLREVFSPAAASNEPAC